MIMDKTIFLIAVFLAGAYAGGYGEPLKCKPSVDITTSLAECYSTKDIIELVFEADCFPINLPLFLFACKSNTCRRIVEVCPVDGVVKIDLSSGFTVGEVYCLRIQTDDAYYGDATGYFRVGERAISISPIKEKCISYGDIITINYNASCFPPSYELCLFYCCDLLCDDLGLITSDDNELEVKIVYPLTVDTAYRIGVRTKDGYVVAKTNEFVVKESCTCCPLIEITSSLESCYGYEDIISVPYRVSCIPYNSYLVISICPANPGSNCFSIGTTSTSVFACTINILNLLTPGLSYYITLSTGDGKAIAKTETFKVDIPRIVVSTDLNECYNPNEILKIIFEPICLPSGTRFTSSVCTDEDCTYLGYVPTDKNKFEVCLLDQFPLGGPYRITIASKNGVEGCTTDFIVGEPCIDFLLCSDDCFTIGGTITLTFATKCFPSVTILYAYLCPTTSENCDFLVDVKSDAKKLDIIVTEDKFKVGEEYFIKLQGENGNPSASSKKFTIEDCCGDVFEITQDVEPCYPYEASITIGYTFYCEVDSYFIVYCCVKNTPEDNCREVTLPTKTVTGSVTFNTASKEINSLPPGFEYYCTLADTKDNGVTYANTACFNVNGVSCPISCETTYNLSPIKRCYSSAENRISVDFSYTCLPDNKPNSDLEYSLVFCKIEDSEGVGEDNATEDFLNANCDDARQKFKPKTTSGSHTFSFNLNALEQNCWYRLKVVICQNIAAYTPRFKVMDTCASN